MKRERLTISFGKGQRKRLKEIAEKEQSSMNAVIRRALRDYIDSNGSDAVGKSRSKSASKAGSKESR